MQTVHAIEIGLAAKQLGIGSTTLFRELRQRGILSDKNIPVRHYVECGDFVLQQRMFHLRGTLIKRYYPITLVTARGLSLLDQIAQDIRHAVETGGQMASGKRFRVQSEQDAEHGHTGLSGVATESQYAA